MVIDKMNSGKKATLNYLIDASICRMIDTRQIDFYMETRLNRFREGIMYLESIIHCVMTQNNFITPVHSLAKDYSIIRWRLRSYRLVFKMPSVNCTSTVIRNQLGFLHCQSYNGHRVLSQLTKTKSAAFVEN